MSAKGGIAFAPDPYLIRFTCCKIDLSFGSLGFDRIPLSGLGNSFLLKFRGLEDPELELSSSHKIEN